MRKLNTSILASAARTATPTAVQQKTTSGPCLHIILDVTAVVLTPSIVLTVDAYDDVSDTWYNILTGAAVTTISNNVYKIGPGLTESANAIVADYLPDNLRYTVTHADADSITYSLSTNEMY